MTDTPPNPARAACEADHLADQGLSMSVEFRRGMAFAHLCLLQRDDDPVEAVGILRARITRALAILDTAPDPVGVKLTRNDAAAIQAANRQAHAVLSEGCDPPSKRRAEDKP